MTAVLYATPADLVKFGMPRGAVPNPGRLLGAVSVSASTLIQDVHGLAEDDAFYLATRAGGTLPAPLVADVKYYAKVVDESRFQARATAGGSAITLTASGDPERVLVVVPLDPLAWIQWASRVIDDMLPAHVVPLVAPYPELVVMTCAELAIGKGCGFGGSSSKTLSQVVDYAQKRLARWATGVPVRPGDDTQNPANLAVSAAAPYRDVRGWNRYGGT